MDYSTIEVLVNQVTCRCIVMSYRKVVFWGSNFKCALSNFHWLSCVCHWLSRNC